MAGARSRTPRAWIQPFVFAQLSPSPPEPDLVGCDALVVHVDAATREIHLYDGVYVLCVVLTSAAVTALDDDPDDLGITSASLLGHRVAVGRVRVSIDVYRSPPMALAHVGTVTPFCNKEQRPVGHLVPVERDPVVNKLLLARANSMMSSFARPAFGSSLPADASSAAALATVSHRFIPQTSSSASPRCSPPLSSPSACLPQSAPASSLSSFVSKHRGSCKFAGILQVGSDRTPLSSKKSLAGVTRFPTHASTSPAISPTPATGPTAAPATSPPPTPAPAPAPAREKHAPVPRSVNGPILEATPDEVPVGLVPMPNLLSSSTRVVPDQDGGSLAADANAATLSSRPFATAVLHSFDVPATSACAAVVGMDMLDDESGDDGPVLSLRDVETTQASADETDVLNVEVPDVSASVVTMHIVKDSGEAAVKDIAPIGKQESEKETSVPNVLQKEAEGMSVDATPHGVQTCAHTTPHTAQVANAPSNDIASPVIAAIGNGRTSAADVEAATASALAAIFSSRRHAAPRAKKARPRSDLLVVVVPSHAIGSDKNETLTTPDMRLPSPKHCCQADASIGGTEPKKEVHGGTSGIAFAPTLEKVVAHGSVDRALQAEMLAMLSTEGVEKSLSSTGSKERSDSALQDSLNLAVNALPAVDTMTAQVKRGTVEEPVPDVTRVAALPANEARSVGLPKHVARGDSLQKALSTKDVPLVSTDVAEGGDESNSCYDEDGDDYGPNRMLETQGLAVSSTDDDWCWEDEGEMDAFETQEPKSRLASDDIVTETPMAGDLDSSQRGSDKRKSITRMDDDVTGRESGQSGGNAAEHLSSVNIVPVNAVEDEEPEWKHLSFDVTGDASDRGHVYSGGGAAQAGVKRTHVRTLVAEYPLVRSGRSNRDKSLCIAENREETPADFLEILVCDGAGAAAVGTGAVRVSNAGRLALSTNETSAHAAPMAIGVTAKTNGILVAGARRAEAKKNSTKPVERYVSSRKAMDSYLERKSGSTVARNVDAPSVVTHAAAPTVGHEASMVAGMAAHAAASCAPKVTMSMKKAALACAESEVRVSSLTRKVASTSKATKALTRTEMNLCTKNVEKGDALAGEARLPDEVVRTRFAAEPSGADGPVEEDPAVFDAVNVDNANPTGTDGGSEDQPTVGGIVVESAVDLDQDFTAHASNDGLNEITAAQGGECSGKKSGLLLMRERAIRLLDRLDRLECKRATNAWAACLAPHSAMRTGKLASAGAPGSSFHGSGHEASALRRHTIAHMQPQSATIVPHESTLAEEGEGASNGHDAQTLSRRSSLPSQLRPLSQTQAVPPFAAGRPVQSSLERLSPISPERVTPTLDDVGTSVVDDVTGNAPPSLVTVGGKRKRRIGRPGRMAAPSAKYVAVNVDEEMEAMRVEVEDAADAVGVIEEGSVMNSAAVTAATAAVSVPLVNEAESAATTSAVDGVAGGVRAPAVGEAEELKLHEDDARGNDEVRRNVAKAARPRNARRSATASRSKPGTFARKRPAAERDEEEEGDDGVAQADKRARTGNVSIGVGELDGQFFGTCVRTADDFLAAFTPERKTGVVEEEDVTRIAEVSSRVAAAFHAEAFR
jgi:hypothetical protein